MATDHEIIRDMRKAAGISQEALAKVVGLKQTTISGIEKGRVALNTPTRLRLLAAIEELKDGQDRKYTVAAEAAGVR